MPVELKIGDFKIVRTADLKKLGVCKQLEDRERNGLSWRLIVDGFQLDHPWERPPLIDTRRTPPEETH